MVLSSTVASWCGVLHAGCRTGGDASTDHDGDYRESEWCSRAGKRCGVGAWKRCERCRKVLAAEAFEDDAETCTACLTAPVAKPRVARACAVKTVRAATPPAERTPLLGVVGSGDLEVRERRAKKAALQQLSEVHAEDFEQLLQAARRSEGLRV
jgi:hypothetical protein